MRPKSLMLLLLALGCGLVASIGISQVIESRNRAAAPASEKESIYVAKQDIKVNQPLTPQILSLEEWPKDKIPPDAIRDLKEIQGQRAGTTILSGEPLRKAKFAVDKRIDEIPAGYRVVAVSADAVAAIGNLVQPGDRVDVLLFIEPNNKSEVQQSLTKTILQDVRVFAVNEQWRAAEDKSNESITAKTVSLLVTPEEAEKMMQATELGKIRLVLRNPDDTQVSDTNGTDTQELLTGESNSSDRNKEWGVKQKKQDKEAAAPQDNQEHFVMNVVKGGELSQLDMSRSGNGPWTLGEAKVIVPADPKDQPSVNTATTNPTPPLPTPITPNPIANK